MDGSIGREEGKGTREGIINLGAMLVLVFVRPAALALALALGGGRGKGKGRSTVQDGVSGICTEEGPAFPTGALGRPVGALEGGGGVGRADRVGGRDGKRGMDMFRG